METTKNKAPAATGADARLEGGHGDKSIKQQAVLEALASGSLNRFEAERELGEHCLNSTIAILRSRGHIIADAWESVPTRFNKVARVKRYHLVELAPQTQGGVS